MERLYGPWRRAFIESAASNERSAGGIVGCFLCEKWQADASQDRENLVLVRGERVYALLNLYPYNSGHTLVAPYEHTADFAGLRAETAQELTRVAQTCVDTLNRTYQPQGFNLGMNLGQAAGAGLPDHLHLHVVPRWNGDTNFMPIFGKTKVLPESLDQTVDRLRAAFSHPHLPGA